MLCSLIRRIIITVFCCFFLQFEDLWHPHVEQVYQQHFPNSISSLHVSVSHFGNSHISNFFIAIVFVMVIFLTSVSYYRSYGSNWSDNLFPFFNFFNWDNSVLFPIMTAQINIPTKSVPEFSFLHILNNIYYLWCLWWKPFWQVWGNISLWFWFVFPLYLVMLSIFSWACWPSVCGLGKNVYSGLLVF